MLTGRERPRAQAGPAVLPDGAKRPQRRHRQGPESMTVRPRVSKREHLHRGPPAGQRSKQRTQTWPSDVTTRLTATSKELFRAAAGTRREGTAETGRVHMQSPRTDPVSRHAEHVESTHANQHTAQTTHTGHAENTRKPRTPHSRGPHSHGTHGPRAPRTTETDRTHGAHQQSHVQTTHTDRTHRPGTRATQTDHARAPRRETDRRRLGSRGTRGWAQGP